LEAAAGHHKRILSGDGASSDNEAAFSRDYLNFNKPLRGNSGNLNAVNVGSAESPERQHELRKRSMVQDTPHFLQNEWA